jgi:hypothetical protein
MSAKDDAETHTPARTHLALTVALAIAAGASVGALVALIATPADVAFFESRLAWVGEAPAAGEAAGPAQPGESVRLERTADGPVLVVHAARAPRARELAATLMARRTGGLRELMAASDTLSARWGASLPVPPRGTLLLAPLAAAPGETAGAVRRVPMPEPLPEARCASWLSARARLRRELVAAVPPPWATAEDAPAPVPPDGLFDRMRDVALAVDRRDDAELARALVAEAIREDEWFADGAPSPDAALRQRAAAWRAWQLARADSLDATAARVLADLTPLQRMLAGRGVDHALLELALRSPRPYGSLVRSITPGWTPVASPIARAWERWLGGGALIGALAGAMLAWLAALVLRPRRSRREMFVAARDPGARASWLHLVSGPTPASVARAVVELSAHALARNERVLVVDGSRRLKLHERFGREARWGLMECLHADMPVIGLVQYGGRPGFYLLAHGNTARVDGWAAIGQRLDDARPHFGRIVLALDATAPREIGDALAGRAIEGWWAESASRLPQAALELTERLGIAFSGMDLSVVPHGSLETLAGRSRALALLAPEPPAELPPLPVAVEAPVAEVAPSEPLVLDCDLQMRQRLRFLAWMRRVQSERRRTEAESVL